MRVMVIGTLPYSPAESIDNLPLLVLRSRAIVHLPTVGIWSRCSRIPCVLIAVAIALPPCLAFGSGTVRGAGLPRLMERCGFIGPLVSVREGTYPVRTERCEDSAWAYGDGGTAAFSAGELHQ